MTMRSGYKPLEMEEEKNEHANFRPRSRRVPSKLTLATLLLAALFLLSWVWNDHQLPPLGRLKEHGSSSSSGQKKYKAPRKNVWADLSEDEVEDVLQYLYTVPNDLNLTRAGKAGAWDNHIAIIEALVPNKTDALTYLDSEAGVPSRYARVIVNRGASEQAGIDDYMVGPLPTSEHTTIAPLTWAYNAGRNYVDNPLPNYEDIIAWFSELGKEVADLVEDLLGEVVNPGNIKDAPPLMVVSRPAAFENGTVSSWARIHSPGLRMDAWSLLAQGMYCRFEIAGRDSSKWRIHEWYYGGILYNSTTSFRSAWKAGQVKKLPANKDGRWSAAEPDEEGVPGREKTAPVMIQPGGPRYEVDEEEKHVSWLGWEFYINSLQAIGLGLWDVKFGGERILYELGLQEAMAHYAGNDPMSVGMVYWLDTLFGMGFNSYELVPGYDCPAYATYLNMTFHQGEQTILRKNSICIFEWTASESLQRHTSAGQFTVSRNNHLIVRHVATVGNYDYTISYIFYLDGTLEVKVQASGYIFGAYHSLESMRKDMRDKRSEHAQYDYGYRIHDFVVSSMHDHEINFKADFDVAGTKNTMEKVGALPYEHTYDWEDVHRSTMRLNHELIKTEQGLNWPGNAGAMYVIFNNESSNIWGEKRGYRITPGTGMGTPPHLTIHNSPSMSRSASWAYKDLWLLRHHDTERRSAHEYNALAPQDPLIDFEKMIDGEDTVQEDLVVYFNLGSHHVPHSGDVPNTLMHTSASSVMFVPVNFHDRDPSRARAQGVKLVQEGVGRWRAEYFGGRYESDVQVPVEQLDPDLSKFSAYDPEGLDLSWNATLALL